MNPYLAAAHAVHWLTTRRCRRRGHDWLLGYSTTVYVSGEPTSEFIPITDHCLRCAEQKVTLPWRKCLRQHPLAKHYNTDGSPREHPWCPGPM